MAPIKLVLSLGLAFWTATGTGLGSPSDGVLLPVQEAREASWFTFEVHAPRVSASGGADSAEIRIAGFDVKERRAGAPELPGKIVLVAIPPGVTPVLAVRPIEESLLPAIRPRAAARSEVDQVVEGPDQQVGKGVVFRTAEGPGREVSVRQVRIEDPKIYEGTETYPASIAWLGNVGVLRDQRYVEVHLAPVRYDPAISGLRVQTSYQVTVHFDGDSAARSDLQADRVFEDVYRKAFVNYAQGTTFRLSAVAPPLEILTPTATEATLGGPALRYWITIRQNGIVRLDHARMSASALPFLAENLSTWKLTSRGIEVPLQVQDDGDGILEAGEWVQFYGQRLDDEPKAVLNHDFPGDNPDIFEARDFTDENVYLLTVDGGGPRARMALVNAVPTNTRIPPDDFEAITHVETDNAFRPLGNADPWFWTPTLCINITPCSGNPPTSRTDSVPLPGLRLGTLPVRVIARLRGNNESATVSPDHKTRITLSNSTPQDIVVNDGTFDGKTIYTHDFTVTPSAGIPATNPVSVKTEVVFVSGTSNQVILDYVEVRYRRSFTASGDVLTFTWPDGDAEFIVGGLSSSTPRIYEITDTLGGTGLVNAVRLTGATASGAGPFSVRFRVDNSAGLPDGTPRRFLVVADPAIPVVGASDVVSDTVSDLRQTSNQAHMVVVYDPSVVDTAQGGALDLLLDLRASQGITSKLAKLEDIEDDFNDGLPGPVAIKKFLTWVMSTNPGEGWASPKPAYVLLLGDASYDYKAGTAQGNYVPTQIVYKEDPTIGYYASDNLLTTVVGNDEMPDLLVGRIAARNTGESNTVLQKTRSYELDATPGSWRKHALFISDRGSNSDPGGDAPVFEQINMLGIDSMQKPPYSARNLRYWSDFCNATSCDAATANAIRAAIKAAVNGTDGFSDGAGLVQYTGHGNFEFWSNDAFFDSDASPPDTSHLMNATELPWLLVHTCLTGGFHTPLDHSMGEEWLKRAGGGAVAVLAPSGLAFDYIGREVTIVTWTDLFGPRKERTLAVPVLDVLVFLCAGGYYEPCQYYTLQGDPALNLRIRSVAPPTNVAAVASHQRVDLSWTASTTSGAKYSVYRSDVQHPTYVNVVSNHTGTTYADTTVQNATTYFYYVVAVDAELFESRWSNFNSDCAVNGPDCVKATPLNPNPPGAPATPTVVDTEKGGLLLITWPASGESDIKNYTLYYDTDPAPPYANSVNVGKANAYAIAGLQNGVRVYVALKATNTSNLTSGFSPEASGVPTFVRGLRSPGFIGTLRLGKSGANALLTWNAVTTDIYGKPDTVSLYQIFRGTTPDFVPTTPIGTSPVPSYTDPGALTAPAPYHYLVRAVDVDGNVGGLGNQLPNGIKDMKVDKAVAPAGDIVLSWPAVTTKIGGGSIRIDHYEVYASGSVFSREQVRDHLVSQVPLPPITGTSVQFTPQVPNQYYSVFAVDERGNVSPF